MTKRTLKKEAEDRKAKRNWQKQEIIGRNDQHLGRAEADQGLEAFMAVSRCLQEEHAAIEIALPRALSLISNLEEALNLLNSSKLMGSLNGRVMLSLDFRKL